MKKIINIHENSMWALTEKFINRSSIKTDELEAILKVAGHNTLSFNHERGLLANYMAGVLEGSIR